MSDAIRTIDLLDLLDVSEVVLEVPEAMCLTNRRSRWWEVFPQIKKPQVDQDPTILVRTNKREIKAHELPANAKMGKVGLTTR